MAWIQLVEESKADGLLGRIYAAARKRAGRVAQILQVQSNNPPILKSMIDVYVATMFLESPLTRAQREMLAVVTSRANDCHY